MVLGVLSTALLLVAVAALFVGSASISPRAVLSAMAGRAAPESVERVVTLSIRLPRIAVAALAGGALAVAGVAFQALTRNPLAEPSVLGVSSGAAFGVVLGQSLGLGLTFLEAAGLTAFAFAGALLAAVGFWLVASHARELNLMALGEETALVLGVGAERLKLTIFVGASLLTASVVAFTGPIGFVGLIVPHALRILLGSDNRLLVPASLLGGGIFLLVADTVARNVVAPAEMSVGVITSLCGAPFFVYLLRTRYRANL